MFRIASTRVRAELPPKRQNSRDRTKWPPKWELLDLVLDGSAVLKNRADAFGDQFLVRIVGSVGLEIGPVIEVRDDCEFEVPLDDRHIVTKLVAPDLRNRGG